MANTFNFELFGMISPQKFFEDSKSRKDKITRLNMVNAFRRTSRMFDWKGLPETIPQRYLELVIQITGVCGIIKQDNKYYSVWGGLGGVPNYNYMPSWFIVSNPFLKITSKTYQIYGEDKDCVIIPNDCLFQGMKPLISYHSELLTEIQLTKRCAMIWHRAPNMAIAPNNEDKEAIDGYFKDLEEGNLKSIYSKSYLKNIESIDTNSEGHNIITQILEMEQYQKASLFNDIGLQMNYNMKRESITSSEAQLGESALLPLCDDMLEMRRKACEEIKKLWGLDWEVDFSSAWKDLRKSIEVEMKSAENEANGVQLTGQGDSNESNRGDIIPDGNDISSDDNDNRNGEEQGTNGSNVSQTYQEAVEVVEPIIEATKQVIENIADVQLTGQEEIDNEKTD